MTDDRQRIHQAWQRAAQDDSTQSVVDVARRVAIEARNLSPMLRALAVTPVYVRPGPDGALATSRAGGEAYLHAFSSPVRLTGSLSVEEDQLSLAEVLVADLAARAPEPVGVRLDPGTDVEVSLDPRQVREVRAIAAGVATPAAITAVEGEELLHQAGPAEVTELDGSVLQAVHEVDAGARVRRHVTRLDGVGGRDWPVYWLEPRTAEPDRILQSVYERVTAPVVAIAGRQPAWAADRLADGLDVAYTLYG